MPLEVFDDFKGLFTNADEYTNPGSAEMTNCKTNISKDLIKAKGYSRVTPASQLVVTDISVASDAVLTVDNSLSSSGTVILYDVANDDFADVLEGKAWNISAAASSTITLEGADTSAITKSDENLMYDAIEFNEIDDTVTNSGVTYDATETINSRITGMGAYNGANSDYLQADVSSTTSANVVISFWINPNLTLNPMCFDFSDGGANPRMYASTDGENIDFFIKEGATTASVGTIVISDTLKHVCILVENSGALSGSKSIRVYVNAVSAGTSATTFTDFGLTDLVIGNNYVKNQGFTGKLYDFTVFDYDSLSGAGISDADIATYLYNNTFGYSPDYKFCHEYSQLTATLDTSISGLSNFASSGGTTY